MVGITQANGTSKADTVLMLALCSAAKKMGLTADMLASCLHIPAKDAARMLNGANIHLPDYHAAIRLITICDRLWASHGPGNEAPRAWLQAEHETLGGIPAKLLLEAETSIKVHAYLCA